MAEDLSEKEMIDSDIKQKEAVKQLTKFETIQKEGRIMKNFQIVSIWFALFFFIGQTGSLIAQSGSNLDSLAEQIRINLWDNPELAQQYAIEYNELVQSSTDIKNQAKGSNFIGLTYYVQGDLVNAIEYYLMSYDLIKQTDDKRYGGILLNNIGAAYDAREKPIETQRYYKEALGVFEEINDTFWIANVTNNLAIQYNALGELENAEKYFLQAKEKFQQLEDSASLNILLVNVASLYKDQKEWRRARQNIEQYLQSDPPKDDSYVYGLNTLSLVEIEAGNLSKAEELLKEALDISEEKGFFQPGLVTRNNFYELFKRQDKYRQALTAYEGYIALKDTIFNQDKDAQLTEMLEKYEAREKQTEIERLNLEDDLSQARISQQRYGLLGAVGALGLLGFFSYRLRNKNRRIQKQDQEKEVLLKEIHHRVKNNLQVISSLLGLQGLSIKDAKAKAAIQEGRSRVHSMSLIHQSLYKKDNLTGIEMKPYLQKLTADLIATYNYQDVEIQSVINSEDITLDVETVVPIGLIINELVTNSVKYAFEGRQKGVIQVELSEDNGLLRLVVSDNGIGLDNDQLKTKEDSYGHSLIRAFRDKLDAEIKVENQDGTKIDLIIKSYKVVA